MPNDSAEPLIGVINAGSSSLKFSFYEGERRLLSGQVDGIGVRPAAQAVGPDGKAVAPPDFAGDPPSSPSEVLAGDAALGARAAWRPAPRGARAPRRAWRAAAFEAGAGDLGTARRAGRAGTAGAVARTAQSGADPHGDDDQPGAAAGGVLRHRVSPHRPRGRAGIRAALRAVRGGYRRYGFHGLSYEYIASVLPQRAPEIAGGRVVVAHLGNGCSACAMQAGRSVATTMGFTALDGLPMGTRLARSTPAWFST